MAESAAATNAAPNTGLVHAGAPTTTADKPTDSEYVHKPAPKGPKFDNPFDKALYELNLKHGGSADDAEFKSLAQITDEVQAAAPENQHGKAPEKKAKEAPANAGQQSRETAPAPVEPPPPAAKKRYQVGDKVYELTPEQADRAAQKGIFWEQRAQSVTQAERNIQNAIAQLQQQQQQFQAQMQAFAQNPAAVYEQLYGPERARQAFEPYVGQHVIREMEYEKNPAQRAIDEANRRAMIAEQTAQQAIQQLQAQQQQAQSSQLANEYQQIIIQALEKTNNQHMKNDLVAADMATWMKRGLERKVQYTPEQLVELVKEDYQNRTKAVVGAIASAINDARKRNNQDEVIRLGEELVGLLGRDAMYAIGKYHVATLKKNTPSFPKPVVETQRTPDPKPEKKAGYMTGDQVEAKRKRIVAALERGEVVPENVWEIEW